MAVEVPPGPPRVQIQTQAGCNGRCVFCPNEGTIQARLAQGKMSADLFHKIVDELGQTPPRRVGLYLMNEPLIDKRLADFVRYVTDRIPTTKTQIITNGTLLTPERAEALLDAGIQQIKVSLQSIHSETNRQIMGFDCEEVIENCFALQKLLERRRANHARASARVDFRVSMIVTRLNMDEIDGTRAFWRKHGIRLVTSALENRGGNIADAAELNPHEMKSRSDCTRPCRDFMILYNGDVALCCVDWYRTAIMGNVARQTIREVWHGPRFQHVRQALRDGASDQLPRICRDCAESALPDYHRRGFRGFLSRLLACA